MTRAYIKSFIKKNKKLGISTGRAGNVIGGGDWSEKRLIPDSIRSIMKNKTIELRNQVSTDHGNMYEPLKGYLVLAKRQYLNPIKYSGAWNFGTNPNSLTTVKKIVEYIIKFWGKGKLISKKKSFYEQANLQLNINKAKKNLNWKPTYNIKDSVKFTTEWYYKVLKEKKSPQLVTKNQIIKYMYDSKIN